MATLDRTSDHLQGEEIFEMRTTLILIEFVLIHMTSHSKKQKGFKSKSAQGDVVMFYFLLVPITQSCCYTYLFHSTDQIPSSTLDSNIGYVYFSCVILSDLFISCSTHSTTMTSMEDFFKKVLLNIPSQSNSFIL